MKFGILGDAKIAREKVIPAIRSAGHDVIALGRRSLTQKQVILSMTALSDRIMMVLAHPDVDIIYNPLPNPSACSLVDQGHAGRQACDLRKANCPQSW